MALITVNWDLPPEEKMDKYKEKAFITHEERPSWITNVMKQKGFKELRAYRNPYHTTPQVLIFCEFNNLDSCMKYIESKDYTTFISELREVGCTNISAQFWGTSPMVPEPIKSQNY
ncbi:hypothetical protein ACFL6H_01800 [Candidatus Latescibacterota bacterium]